MRRVAILCGLCLAMTGAAALGAPFRSSSRTASAPTALTSLVGGRLRQNSEVAHSSTEEGRARHGNVQRTHRSKAAQVMLLGEQAIEPMVDDNLAGTVEGFAFRARRSGTAASIKVYLDGRARANTLFAGLYSSRHGHPQSLLTSGLLRSPKAGAWNSVAVASANLRSGTTYWLAVLGKGGAIYFRDRNHGFAPAKGPPSASCARFRDLARRPELAAAASSRPT